MQGKSGHKPAETRAWKMSFEMKAVQNCLIHFWHAQFFPGQDYVIQLSVKFQLPICSELAGRARSSFVWISNIFNFIYVPDMRPVPNVVWPPPASLISYSDSESLFGHVFSMLSLQSNSGAGQKRPQAGHDMSVKNDMWNESYAKLLNLFFTCTIFSRLWWCYATFCKVSASDLLWARQPCWIECRVKFKLLSLRESRRGTLRLRGFEASGLLILFIWVCFELRGVFGFTLR